MHQRTAGSFLGVVSILAALGVPAGAHAGCGCAKPPPPRAAVRPFVGYVNQTITLFDGRLAPGEAYDVLFQAMVDGTTDWSRGKAATRRDLADGQLRPQLRMKVANVGLGPCRISVWKNGVQLYALGDDQFTVTAAPIALHDFAETVARDGYQAGVGRDGTVYIAVDVSEVSDGTSFTGAADGFPLTFQARNVAMYNTQGFLMQLLDPKVPGLFRITSGTLSTSDALSYWRHEFQTYKQEHRQVDARRNDDDADWHADGSYHVDHDGIVVAVSGVLANGRRPAPGATPPFDLVVTSAPSESGVGGAR